MKKLLAVLLCICMLLSGCSVSNDVLSETGSFEVEPTSEPTPPLSFEEYFSEERYLPQRILTPRRGETELHYYVGENAKTTGGSFDELSDHNLYVYDMTTKKASWCAKAILPSVFSTQNGST